MAGESFPNNFFDTEYLKTDLKGRSVRGGAVTIFSQGASFVLQMCSTFVLARLLTPEDFGLIAMVTAITGFVTMFKDMGLSMATVQKAEINHAQISTLFWINLGLSTIIMLIIAAIAPVISWFYHEPRLVWITLALAGSGIFSGLTIQHHALLRRQMRFGILAIITIISLITGIITAIIAALLGAQYWAIVLMYATGNASGAVAVWLFLPWRPGLPKRGSGVREMIGFGGSLTGFNFLNYFARNLDNILIGRYWGTESLGYYSKAYNLLMLPLRQINAPLAAVAIPALSSLQNEPEKYKRYYLKTISLIAFFTMPLMIFLVIMSKEIILLILGEQWIESSKIFSILGINAIVQPVISSNGWLHVSIGRTDRLLKWAFFAVPAFIISFIIGLPYGAIGIATCYTICMFSIAIPCLWYACKPTPVTLISIGNTLWRTTTSTLTVGLALIAFKTLFPLTSQGVSGVIIGFIITVVIFIGSHIALEPNGKTLYDIIHLIRELK